MRRFFTVTSPDNALALGIYAMFTFYSIVFVFVEPSGPVSALGHVWSTALLISSSGALFATLSAPKRRDPDQSLIIEFWTCLTLCILSTWLVVSLFWYTTDSGAFPVTTFGASTIFAAAFGFRCGQIRGDRRALRRYRASHPIK